MNLLFFTIIYLNTYGFLPSVLTSQPDSLVEQASLVDRDHNTASMTDNTANDAELSDGSSKDLRNMIPEKLSEDSLELDPGYNEGTIEDYYDTESLLYDQMNLDESSEVGKQNENLEMLDGFEGNRDPLPFEEEIKDEERLFGKIPEPEGNEFEKRSSIDLDENEADIEEDDETSIDEEDFDEGTGDQIYDDEQKDEADENIVSDDDDALLDDSESLLDENYEQKRNSIADSDENMIGRDLDDQEIDFGTDIESRDSLSETRVAGDSSKSPDYDKLLNELEEDKEDDILDYQKQVRSEIARPLDLDTEIESGVSQSDSLIEEEAEDLDNYLNNDIDRLIYETQDVLEDKKDFVCNDPKVKRNIIEYIDVDETMDNIKDAKEDAAADLVEDSQVMTFDCADCVDIDDGHFSQDGEIGSSLFCPDSETKRQDVERPIPYIVMSSEGTNKTRRSIMPEFIKKTDYICNEKCKNAKRTTIESDSLTKLSQIKLWNSLNPDILYHRVPRASVGIMVDGNLNINPLIMNLVLNLMLLFSRDSMMTLGVFRTCLKTVDMPGQVMKNSYTTYYDYIQALQKLSRETDLGVADDRNVDYGIKELRQIINAKAKEINTELKIIMVITKGPFTQTGPQDSNLGLTKSQNTRSGVKLYIIQLGSLYKLCQLQMITYSSKIIIVHYINQLVYGGKAKTEQDPTLTSQESYVPVQGVIGVLYRKFRYDAEALIPMKGDITFHRGGIVGWTSDTSKIGLSPDDFTTDSENLTARASISPNYEQIDLMSDNVKLKRQRIGRINRPRNRRRPRRRGRRRNRPNLQRPGRASSRNTRRPGRVSPRNAQRGSLAFLRQSWKWSRVFPSLQRGIVGPTNLIIMLDTMDRSLIDIMQKLLYYTILPFPYTVIKTSIFSLGPAQNVPICKRRAFARSEDIQRMATSISETRGQALAISQRLVKVISPTSRLMSSSFNNVLILILSHRALDAGTFNYISNIIRASRIKLYVFGLGIEDQRLLFIRLSTSARVFTSRTVRSFFTNSMFSRILRQLQLDLGTSERIINLDVSFRLRSVFRSAFRTALRGGSRASRVSSSRRMSQRGRSSRSRSRRIGQSSRSRGSSSRRVTSRRPSRWQRFLSRINRRRRTRDEIETPQIDQPIYDQAQIDEPQFDEPETDQTQLSLDLQPQSTENLDSGQINGEQTENQWINSPSELTDTQDSSADPIQARKKRSATETGAEVESDIEKRQRVAARLPSIIQNILSPEGSVGPGNYIFLIDGTFGARMGLVRQFLKDLTTNFQREGSYFTFATFSSTVRSYSSAIQYRSSTELVSNIERIRGIRSRFRNTGQALTDARRWLIGASPDYPLVVTLILNGQSTDDYRGPTSLLMRDGVKVMVIVYGRSVNDREPLAIQSSSLLSFRTTFARSRRVARKLVPLFNSISGNTFKSRSGAINSFIYNEELADQWKWTVFGSRVLERTIAKTEAATILDTTSSPDKMLKLCYNIMNSFSVRSSHLISTIGVTDINALKLLTFKKYIDQVSTQLVLLGLLGTKARTRYRRAGRRVFSRPKRDVIDDLFKEDTQLNKRAIRGSRYPMSSSGPSRGSHQNTQSRPSYSNRVYNTGSRPTNSRTPLQGSFGPTRMGRPQSQRAAYPGLSPSRIPSGLRASGRPGSGYTYGTYPNFNTGRLPGSNRASDSSRVTGSNRLPGSSRAPSSSRLRPPSMDVSPQDSTSSLDSKFFSLPGSLSQFNSLTSGTDRIRETPGGLGKSRPRRPTISTYGRRLADRLRRLSRMRSSSRYRPSTYRRYRPRGRKMLRGSYRFSFRAGKILCYTRTWRCLTLKLLRISRIMRTRSMVSSYGPNKNKLVNILLSGWPRRLRRDRIQTDHGFRRVARSITRLGVRLIIIVMQRRKTANRFAMPILRAASTSFIHSSWSESISTLLRYQTTSRRLFGQVERMSVSLLYNRFNFKKKTPMSVIPVFGNILPPSTETYMTTKYLTTIQNLRKTGNWKQIVPGLRTKFLRGDLSVIFVVDLSISENQLLIRRTIQHLINMFDRTVTRFSLVLAGSSVSIRSPDSSLINAARIRQFLGQVSGGGLRSGRPRMGAALNIVDQRLIPRIRSTRRSLVMVISQRKSLDDVKTAALRIKNKGAVISVIGIEFKIKISELQKIASSGQLLVTGHVSMLPLMLFRMQFALSLVVNGPSRFSPLVSMARSTPVRVFSTVMRNLKNDEAQKIVPLGRQPVYKRDDIYKGNATSSNSTISNPTPSHNSTIIENPKIDAVSTPPTTPTLLSIKTATVSNYTSYTTTAVKFTSNSTAFT